MLELNANLYNIIDKQNSVQDFALDYLNRTLGMFDYKGLPDSIPEDDVESIFQINGYGIVTEHNDDLIALWGSWAPPYNTYYKAENVLVANPWAKIDRTYRIQDDDEAVLIKNDPRCRGLMPIFRRYGTMMTEAQITFYRALINFRAMFVFTGDDDVDAKTAVEFMKAIEEGKAGSTVTAGYEKQIMAQPLLTSASNYITQSIEAQQYVLGMLYQQIGLQSTFNMKRERQTANETQLDEDPLRPLIDAMLEERQKGWERVNAKYGTDVEVKFKGVWAKYNPSMLDGMPGLGDLQPSEDPVDDPLAEEGTVVPEPIEEPAAEDADVVSEPIESVEDLVETVEEIVETTEEIEETVEEIREEVEDKEEVKEDEDKDSDA